MAEKMKKGDKIRLDWRKAFEDGEATSSAIEWGFSQQDLFVLCCLHEANLFRQEIEDLLEDCNFHAECEYLCNHDYDTCRKFIAESD